jgi:hypothetical protein
VRGASDAQETKQHVFKSEVENACEVVIMATTACLGVLKTLNV